MKTLILIAVFICITILSVFAQPDKKEKPDPRKYFKSEEPSPIPFKIDSSFVFENPSVDSLIKKLNHCSVPIHRDFEFGNPGTVWKFGELFVEDYAMEKMPCYKPQGNYTMPVLKPDPSRHYTLLIK